MNNLIKFMLKTLIDKKLEKNECYSFPLISSISLIPFISSIPLIVCKTKTFQSIFSQCYFLLLLSSLLYFTLCYVLVNKKTIYL